MYSGEPGTEKEDFRSVRSYCWWQCYLEQLDLLSLTQQIVHWP